MIAFDLLVGCALGEIDGESAIAVEEHIVSCGRCARVYESIVRLGQDIAALVRGGGATMQVTGSIAEQLEREGLISSRYELSPGAIVPCSVGIADIYSLTTLQANLSDVQRLDLVRGPERITDIAFDPRGFVRLLSSSEELRKLPTMKLQFRLIAVDSAARERIIAEYTLDHSAFVP